MSRPANSGRGLKWMSNVNPGSLTGIWRSLPLASSCLTQGAGTMPMSDADSSTTDFIASMESEVNAVLASRSGVSREL